MEYTMGIRVKETGFAAWKVFVIIIAVIILAGAVGFGVILSDSNGISIGNDITVTVAEGEGASVVADNLEENGIIKYPMVFRILSKVGGYDNKYQPGAITIRSGMSYNDILQQLITVDRDTVTVVIPEGYEARQIQQALSDAGLPGAEGFMEALDPSLYDYRFLENIPDRTGKLEGYLFPATYKIPENYTAQEIVNLMLKSFDETFIEGYYDRAAELGMSVDQVITMASIVERETNEDTERAKVAGVFYNRLNSGMKLQSCATVQYILGERKPVLSIADTQIDSPYNTYVYSGLPAGPICNPGAACIAAALYPENTDAYYFCLSKSGEHIFSTTYEDHVKAMESNDLTMSVDSSAMENEDSKKQ
ncbi:MAG: endolytic transglycosylase MltG [Candidatus Ornithomonoglobus sp.]